MKVGRLGYYLQDCEILEKPCRVQQTWLRIVKAEERRKFLGENVNDSKQ